MKKLLLAGLAVALMGALAFGAYTLLDSETAMAYGGENSGTGRMARAGGEATGGGTTARVDRRSAIGTASASELSADEAAGLLFMREEEKLARDVYSVMLEKWDLPVFDSIGRSEQAHMDSVSILLERYELDDPAAGLPVGEFANPDLQALYDQLVSQGSRSLEDALRVGAAIEEIDILDLQSRLETTDQQDIQRVYQNLLRGSGNHLRAFVAQLNQLGEDYQPQYLDTDAYQGIISGATGRGSNQRGGRGGNGAGGRGNS